MEDTATTTHTESTTSEQPATDNVVTTTAVDSKPATTVTKTRKKLVAKASPMVAVAVDSTSKPPVPSTVPPLKRQNDLDKQFLADSLKVLVYIFVLCVCNKLCICLSVCTCMYIAVWVSIRDTYNKHRSLFTTT